MLFVVSKIPVVELRRRKRSVTLTFWDFVEACARLADCLDLPPLAVMRRSVETGGEWRLRSWKWVWKGIEMGAESGSEMGVDW